MKFLRPLSLCCLLFTAAIVATSRAQELGPRQDAPGGGFSFAPPKDWTVTTNAADKSISAKGPSGVNLQIRAVAFDGPLADFQKIATGALKAKFATYKETGTSDFSTDSDLKGTRLVYEMQLAKGGPDIRQVAFFFDGPPGQKLFIACGALASLGDKYDEVFDASIKSLELGK